MPLASPPARQTHCPHARWSRRERFPDSPLPGQIAPAIPARERGVVEDIAPHGRGLERRARCIDLCPELMSRAGSGRGDHGHLDEVAGQTQVPCDSQLGGPRQDRIEAAGQADPLPSLLGTGCGQEMVRLTVVPAAVEARQMLRTRNCGWS